MNKNCTCGEGNGVCDSCSTVETKKTRRCTDCGCIQTKSVEQDAKKLLKSTTRVFNYR